GCTSPCSHIRSARLRLYLALLPYPLGSPSAVPRPAPISARLAFGCTSPCSHIRSARLRLYLALLPYPLGSPSAVPRPAPISARLAFGCTSPCSHSSVADAVTPLYSSPP